MIITLAGVSGAGKSTVKALLAERLGLTAYSIGDLRGAMAVERGLTIDEFNALGMDDVHTDREVDLFQEKLGKTQDNFIVDGWLAWHFIPHSVKVFLDVDPHVGAERIFSARQSSQNRNDEPNYQNIEETERILRQRLDQNQARYRKWYKIDFLDRSHYDLIIDTTLLTPEDVVEKIVEFIKS